MNDKITNCLFALPSYFSGLALLVGHREENTNYKKKLIQIASKSGPTMNISLSPQMDGSFLLSYYYWTCQKPVFNSLLQMGILEEGCHGCVVVAWVLQLLPSYGVGA
jgi:hypothetical protein